NAALIRSQDTDTRVRCKAARRAVVGRAAYAPGTLGVLTHRLCSWGGQSAQRNPLEHKKSGAASAPVMSDSARALRCPVVHHPQRFVDLPQASQFVTYRQ